MKIFILLLLVWGVFVDTPSAAARETMKGPLFDYVAKADASYHWTKRQEGSLSAGSYVELLLISQTWRDTVWKHQLYIIKPSTVAADARHALLFIGGGRWSKELEGPGHGTQLPNEAELFGRLAEHLQTPVAILRHVPHQPLLGGRNEDQLIALTFEEYLQTRDPEWPLLLPMVKSAVRAMDAVQAYTEQAWSLKIETFTVTGASKRGWTTWLTGAVDPRATAIAPMVIDMLNLNAHLQHQEAVWGRLSPKLGDYTERGLHKQLETEGGRALQAIVDPYSYRHLLTQPKLIMIGTNDPYWPLDALNLYWDELEGRNYILYVPNNGHSLRDYPRIIGSLSALHQHVANGKRLPALSWGFNEDKGKLSLHIESDIQPRQVVAWIALSATQDFHEAQWQSYPMQAEGDGYRYELALPNQGYAAVFGEAVYDDGDATLPYFLSTKVRIIQAPANSSNRPTEP